MQKRTFFQNTEKITSISIAVFIVYTFIFHLSYPVFWDDWIYSVDFQTFVPYTLEKAWHPGRNISEFIHTSLPQTLGASLGVILNDPLLGIRISHAIGATLIMVLFWFVSMPFVSSSIKKPHTSFLYLVLALLSVILLDMTFKDYTAVTFNTGGLVFAMSCFIPVIYYYKHNSLPDFIQDHFAMSLGVFLALAYMGTQIQDTSYFLIGQAFGWFLVFLGLRILFPHRFEAGALDYSKDKLLLFGALSYLFLCLFALFRNTFLGARDEVAKQYLSLDPHVLLQRISYWKLYYIIIALFALFFLIYFGLKIFKKLAHKIDSKISNEEFYLFSLFAAGIGTLLISLIVKTYAPHAFWLLFLALLRLWISWYQKNSFIQIITPTLFLFFSDSFYFNPSNENTRNQRSY
ncbi:MAG: hypothetical protein ACRCS8_05225 [Brevinema sp.]